MWALCIMVIARKSVHQLLVRLALQFWRTQVGGGMLGYPAHAMTHSQHMKASSNDVGMLLHVISTYGMAMHVLASKTGV